ncbi:hypothetical protein C8E87_7304 [Paractinoplanes brasiliensis]|uniref:Uncharacterized protein n=1 Tax=Paractinoplanes brasiliensis TaxID=52695 RepID=A0A4R6J8H6_9ACTN|nr:hypothetical protein C8E87_7304 [Actinoplanes brasiliensis]
MIDAFVNSRRQSAYPIWHDRVLTFELHGARQFMHGPVVIVHSRRNRRHARPDPGAKLLPGNGRVPADTQATTRLGITPPTRRKATPPQRKRQTTVAGFRHQSRAPRRSEPATSSSPHPKRTRCRPAIARSQPAHGHASPHRPPSSTSSDAKPASHFAPHAADFKPTDEPTSPDSPHKPTSVARAVPVPVPPSRDESRRRTQHGGPTTRPASPPTTKRPVPNPPAHPQPRTNRRAQVTTDNRAPNCPRVPQPDPMVNSALPPQSQTRGLDSIRPRDGPELPNQQHDRPVQAWAPFVQALRPTTSAARPHMVHMQIHMRPRGSTPQNLHPQIRVPSRRRFQRPPYQNHERPPAVTKPGSGAAPPIGITAPARRSRDDKRATLGVKATGELGRAARPGKGGHASVRGRIANRHHGSRPTKS